jgi:uncharacterized protein YbjT (DUF2867 family)
MRVPPFIAVVAGSTGLIGAHLLPRLVAAPEYGRVIALTRRPLPSPPHHAEQRAADFDRLDEVLGDLSYLGERIDVFCCLGTTLRTAGSKSAFRRVDHDYVLALGRWAARVGAHRFLLVSALGADTASRVFYNRVKGETEAALQALRLNSLVIARPSLLDGDRAELRIGERLAIIASRRLRAWIPARLRPIRAEDVATALLLAARDAQPAAFLESAQMHGAAQKLAPSA